MSNRNANKNKLNLKLPPGSIDANETNADSNEYDLN